MDKIQITVRVIKDGQESEITRDFKLFAEEDTLQWATIDMLRNLTNFYEQNNI